MKKNIMKRVLTIILVITCLFSLTACGDTEKKPPFEYDESQLTENVQAVFEQLIAFTDEQLEQIKEAKTTQADVGAVNTWLQTRDELGDFVKTGEFDIVESDDKVTVTLKTEFTKRQMNFQIVYEKVKGQITPTDIVCEAQYSMGEKLTKAGLNTLMGMGTVFAVLIFIAFLLSLFKYIPMLFDKSVKGDDLKKQEPIPVPVIQEESSENLMDDLELVAVVAAAIAASQQTGTDAFVVRTIRKVNQNKWKRA